MDKETIMKELESMQYWEDKFVLDYDNESVRQLLEVTYPDKFEKIWKLMEENIKDSEKHSRMVAKIRELL